MLWRTHSTFVELLFLVREPWWSDCSLQQRSVLGSTHRQGRVRFTWSEKSDPNRPVEQGM